ncbi:MULTISPECIES: hypothetical protein [unclassified Pseudofrankia]|uniref:hypothetical protein n=1 Tax=unclassified Pseudofrankia TaxID=2994372 RepID=UPI0008D9BF9E|nr:MULTISPECIES: hypothetical protein [unclassified Pseudofrankia]MDT3440257.1 hypothetical protein [Pseudofrankia sp. BMG5.37]OHV73407.1 hypothetical protein BCD48_33515 [Pseudofrankia sp. BMG5.36]
MPTDPQVVALRSEEPSSGLVDRVQYRSRSVVDAELRRLARKVPTLDRADLDVIDAALEELADSLVIARLRSANPDTETLLTELFGFNPLRVRLVSSP